LVFSIHPGKFWTPGSKSGTSFRWLLLLRKVRPATATGVDICFPCNGETELLRGTPDALLDVSGVCVDVAADVGTELAVKDCVIVVVESLLTRSKEDMGNSIGPGV
jgi:hypothetical protein